MPSGRLERALKYCLGVSALGLLCACLGVGVLAKTWSDDLERAVRATADAEQALTSTYGSEAGAAIQHFESNWLSADAHRNPSLQTDVAAGPYLDYFGLARAGAAIYDEPYWLVTGSATIDSVRVVEYGPERFKALACTTDQIDEVTPQGALIRSRAPYQRCGVYVFVRVKGVWKLAGFVDMMDGRNYEWYGPTWLRDIVGELPEQ